MKSLYNEEGRYTTEAINLDRETHAMIFPLFKKYVEQGYSRREVSHILHETVFNLEAVFSNWLVDDNLGS